jgi:hypothetical protein
MAGREGEVSPSEAIAIAGEMTQARETMNRLTHGRNVFLGIALLSAKNIK